jgi:hypothetical protein
MALLLNTKFCFTVASTYILDTSKFIHTNSATTFRRGIVALTCKDGYSVFTTSNVGVCVSC